MRCGRVLGVLAAAVGVLAAWAFMPRIDSGIPPRPEDFVSPEHLTVQWPHHERFESRRRPGLTLQVYKWPPKSGEYKAKGMVFMLHGFGDHSDANAAVAREFAASDLLVYSIDIEGHGRSEGIHGLRGYVENFNDTALDCIDFARQEAAKNPHVEDVFFWGESMGGLVSLLAMHKAPDLIDGGVLLCPAVGGHKLYPVLEKIAHVANMLFPTAQIAPSISDENGLTGLVNDPAVHFHYAVRRFFFFFVVCDFSHHLP
jgi:alpha-beta hydrolase superfamily lysophospholipase